MSGYFRWSGTLKGPAVSVMATSELLTSSGRSKTGDSPSALPGILFPSSLLRFQGGVVVVALPAGRELQQSGFRRIELVELLMTP